MNISSPNSGGIVGLPVIANFANPMQFICSSIQAGSRLGYQESAELCAQYLAPILDAIKFNFPPIGLNQFVTADDAAEADCVLRATAAAAAGLQGHHGAGHLLARHPLLPRQPRAGLGHRARYAGHRGAAVRPSGTSRPECLAELLGGPDCVPPDAPPAFGVNNGRLPGPPDAYDENNPLPPPWYPQPGPPPGPAPGVIPGDPLGAITPRRGAARTGSGACARGTGTAR